MVYETMKILLNLLPPEKKLGIRKNIRFRLIVVHGCIVILLSIVYCGLLLGVSFALSNRLDTVRTTVNSETGASKKDEIEAYEKIFTDTNTKVSEILKLSDKHVMWGKFFRSIESATPERIFYTKILTKTDYSLTMNGTAPSRESLLLLEKNMNDSDCFHKASIPLSDKLEKENIDFQLTAMIEVSCIVHPDMSL